MNRSEYLRPCWRVVRDVYGRLRLTQNTPCIGIDSTWPCGFLQGFGVVVIVDDVRFRCQGALFLRCSNGGILRTMGSLQAFPQSLITLLGSYPNPEP